MTFPFRSSSHQSTLYRDDLELRKCTARRLENAQEDDLEVFRRTTWMCSGGRLGCIIRWTRGMSSGGRLGFVQEDDLDVSSGGREGCVQEDD